MVVLGAHARVVVCMVVLHTHACMVVLHAWAWLYWAHMHMDIDVCAYPAIELTSGLWRCHTTKQYKIC